MSVIGDRMRELRGPSSLKEMADAIGIKYSAWARYESGIVQPGAEIITKICAAHAVSANWLLGLPERGVPSVVNNSGAVSIGSGSAFNKNVTVPEPRACTKCPYKKKLKALEKLISK